MSKDFAGCVTAESALCEGEEVTGPREAIPADAVQGRLV